VKKKLKFLVSSSFIILTLLVPQEIGGMEATNTESEFQTITYLFENPEETTGLPVTFGNIPENGEMISQEDQEERVRTSTKKFMERKNRKSLKEDNTDTFTNILRLKDIPVTYLTGLSIDGGGTRGLIPALLLRELSSKLNKPLHHYFDYIGGTSIGGILALALTAPKFGDSDQPLSDVNELVELFYKRGNDIFPQAESTQRSVLNFPMKLWDGLNSLMGAAKTAFVSEYNTQGLEGLLKEKFGEETFFDQTLTNTLITAVETGQARSQTYLFNSRSAKKLYNNDDIRIPLWKVGRSTSAAPTYFPAYNINIEGNDGRIYSNHTLVDGGLWLNNPSTIVARALLNFASEESLFASHKNIIMLSLGTGYPESNHQIPRNTGKLNAIVPLIDTLMNVSSFSAHESLQEMLGKSNYKRINPQLKKEIKLDEIDIGQLEILEEAVKKQYGEIDKFIDGPFRKALEKDEFKTKRK
jgi:uncharacterized protein